MVEEACPSAHTMSRNHTRVSLTSAGECGRIFIFVLYLLNFNFCICYFVNGCGRYFDMKIKCLRWLTQARETITQFYLALIFILISLVVEPNYSKPLFCIRNFKGVKEEAGKHWCMYYLITESCETCICIQFGINVTVVYMFYAVCLNLKQKYYFKQKYY